MPTSVHVPKRIDSELIRQRIGDARFEKLALEIFGPMLMPPKVPRDHYKKVKAALDGTANGHAKQAIPLVFRAYLIENPRQRKGFESWLADKLAEANGRGEELNGAEMHEIRVAAKARVRKAEPGRKRGRPKGSRNRAKVAR